MAEHTFDVVGRLIAVTGKKGSWQAFLLGNESKRRPADLFHEWACPAHSAVRQWS